MRLERLGPAACADGCAETWRCCPPSQAGKRPGERAEGEYQASLGMEMTRAQPFAWSAQSETFPKEQSAARALKKW